MYEVHYEPVVLPTMVTIKEAAKASGLAVYRVRQLCKEGKVKHIHCGRRILIQLQSLRDYLEAGVYGTTWRQGTHPLQYPRSPVMGFAKLLCNALI